MVRTMWMSLSQEKKEVLSAVSLGTGGGIIVLDRTKEVIMVDLGLQLYQHQQVTRISRVTYLVLAQEQFVCSSGSLG